MYIKHMPKLIKIHLQESPGSALDDCTGCISFAIEYRYETIKLAEMYNTVNVNMLN